MRAVSRAMRTRSAAGVAAHCGKAAQAASTARLASSVVARWWMPTTSAGLDGLTEGSLSPVEMDSWPMRKGYSRPNSERTFLRAASMACRLAGWEKSATGSLRNWERVAVAILFYSDAGAGGNAKRRQERDRGVARRPGGLPHLVKCGCYEEREMGRL